jgi:hypothetical protein
MGGTNEKTSPDLLWGCFVGWVETLEKAEKGRA